MTTIGIGDVQITRIEELYGPSFPINALLPTSNLAEVEHLGDRLKDFVEVGGDNLAYVSIHSWLVRTPQKTILVDACNGNHKPRAMDGFGMLDTPFLDRLAAAGAAPTDVDAVVCTHLHLDHVGWNTHLVDGEWVPTFPNATTYINSVELEFWRPTNPVTAALGFNANVFEDSVQPLLDRDTVHLWSGDGLTIDDTLHLALATGHTPGQCVGWLESKGQRAVFAADTLHSPLQVWRPDWICGFDFAPDEAVATRRSIYEQAAERDAVLLAAHLPAPHVFKVRPEGDTFAAINAA
jgi:glyoxylase-like metal-dependent hydrolase (beta-lactamase superfamily II)